MNNNWLYNLELFKCPTCKKDTIFKSGCASCDDIETAKQDFKDLSEEFKQNAKEIKALQDRQVKIINELIQVDTKLNGG